MFEVGAEYWIETGLAEHAGTSVCRVVEVDLPLIKVESVEGIRIINTHSPLFHSAKPAKMIDMTDFDEF